MKNNAASATNLDPDCTASIYYNSGRSGPADYIPAKSSVSRLNNTYNNNASNHWELPAATATTWPRTSTRACPRTRRSRPTW
ncbi:hypothetical protein [Streptomyces sp. Ag109_G2-15]|uniref:hypothetical protein n=1 Tax=Streptomyces sp. Ag109_G2-15 TaxID=1938850 RepID=UPI000BE303C5|nr:hypothetical protein [Streptomyces sp. Ag109_G2-15]